MQVICLQDEALYKLIDELFRRVKEAEHIKEDKWISLEEAMHRLRVKSKATMQRLRDEGLIRYTQPMPKVILYDTNSIDDYLEKHARQTF